ncbi:hypothetical protein [Desertivibrio insolitus]|uniref:hypothetical protein n=1 Tax=Herbiconiux sp. SYSU D00978 TaxID=2812562 RepID=UPI001A95AF85|nr:hypothetical protein [Herbiconiux sp. SYSU D00978]
MPRTTWLAALAAASLLLTGCGAQAQAAPAAEPSHVMPDGSVMPGAEHGDHGAHESEYGPSEAAQMICDGQVVTAVGEILGVDAAPVPSSTWQEPTFTCSYDVDGAPLVLSVHDATEVAEGEAHFSELQGSLAGAETIPGLAGLGMPAFSTGDGVVGFLRDGKTLLVDATALPDGLGASGTKTRDDVAYGTAAAVLVCWVEHD